MFGKLSRSRWLLLLMCLILSIVMSIFNQMEDEGGKIRRQEISGHATNQTFLHIDHAQSMLVRLQFRYPSLIKLLSTQPSCLNVQLTSACFLLLAVSFCIFLFICRVSRLTGLCLFYYFISGPASSARPGWTRCRFRMIIISQVKDKLINQKQNYIIHAASLIWCRLEQFVGGSNN